VKRALSGLVLLAAAGYAASGLYTIAGDEVGVVQRFGRVHPPLREPGLHYGLPWGLDRVQRVRPNEVKEVVVGAAGSADRILGVPASADSAQYLSGDQNLVTIRTSVQYAIAEPTRYLFQAANPDRIVAQATQSVLGELLAQSAIDVVLTTGKAQLAAAVHQRLAQRLDEYQLGIAVRAVSLPELVPPVEVKDAFDAVNSARLASQNEVLDAQRYANQTVFEATSAGRAMVQQAQADATRAEQTARGEARRFEGLLYEYRKQPALAVTQLYFGMIRDVLPRFRSKVFVDGGSGVDLSILREQR
jgi:membrane protease subunit HflK